MTVCRITAVRVDARGFVSRLYSATDHEWVTATDAVISMEVGCCVYLAQLGGRDVPISGVYAATGKHLAVPRSHGPGNALLDLAV